MAPRASKEPENNGSPPPPPPPNDDDDSSQSSSTNSIELKNPTDSYPTKTWSPPPPPPPSTTTVTVAMSFFPSAINPSSFGVVGSTTTLPNGGPTVVIYSASGLGFGGNAYRTTLTSTPSPTNGGFPTGTNGAAAETSNPSYGSNSSNGQNSSPTGGYGEELNHGPPKKFPVTVAMGIIIPLVLIGLSACGFFFCIRRRRREKNRLANLEATSGAGPQMKDLSGAGVTNIQTQHAYHHSPMATPVAATASPISATTINSASSSTPPVILSTTMNNTYYTGIDTSDHISLTDQRSQRSAETFGDDEPPPPYRPRSVPPLSRDASVRTAQVGRNTSTRSSRHEAIGLMPRTEEVRSPFDDPESSSDDDAVSQISTIRSHPRRCTDNLSVVSDLSEQEEEQAQQSHSTPHTMPSQHV